MTARIDEAVSFADDAEFPPPESLYDHVYVLGDQVKGWYSVDERSAGVHKGRTALAAATSAPEGAYDKAVEQTEEEDNKKDADEAQKGRLTGRDALPRGAQRRAARGAASATSRVLLIGEDIGVFNGAFKVTQGLFEEFGEKRVRDTPISENTIVGVGVGAAMTGLRPVVELMTVNFSLLAMDQIVNHMATIHYMFGGQVSVPMVVRMPQAPAINSARRTRTASRRSTLHVPGILLAVPSTPADAKGLLKAAIRDDNPVVFIEHESLYGSKGEVPEDEDHVVDFGQAAIRREGEDVTIVGISRMALTARRRHEDPGGRARGLGRGHRPAHLAPARPRHDPRVRRKTNRCVIVEEGWPHGGVGANLAALIQEQAFDHLDAPISRVTGADVPMPYSKPLEQIAFPHEPQIVETVLSLF